MQLLYDSEGDVLDVIFDERLRRAEKVAYELRDGFILYVSVELTKPIQLTVVNYRRLTERPTFLFSGWKKLKPAEKKKLAPILASSTLSNFLKLDPQSGYGYVTKSSLLDTFPLAA